MASGITNAIGKSNLQDKSVTITQNGTTEITADSGYDGMSKATITTNVPSTPTEEKTVALDMASGNQVITPTSGKVLSKVTITKPSTMLATNIKKDVNIGGVVGTYEGVILPTYTGLLRFASAPTISLSNSTLTITAVDNATSYAIYSNNALLTTITTTSVDLSTLITTAGTYTIYAIAKATGYVDSEKSNEVSYTAASGYSVTVHTTPVVYVACMDTTSNMYVKVGSAPMSLTDYDYIGNSSAVSQTFTGVEKMYIWGNNTANEYSDDMLPSVNGTELSKVGTWNSPNEVTITQDSEVYIHYGYGSEPRCCFLPNTLVNTSNGKVKIEDIKVGDFVGCYDSEYKDYIYGNVTKVIKNTNITELATLELENGTKVQFNSYHPILTKEGWKSLTNFNDYPTLTENDIMALGEKIKSIRIETLDTPLIGYNLVVEPYNNFVIESRIVAEGSNN